ncbi:MAG: hypothetical protein SFY56_03975 [Bacteroidota bacterium]|nr:hypothetical protein [Bacteroidota bacterium]
MKKIILFFISFCCFEYNAQSPAPPKINYQGIARNSQGLPIVNQNISIVFELISGTPTSTAVYTETQPSVQTNSLGLFTTQIGKNSSLIGFNWQGGPYFLKISIDPTGGTNYTSLGTQQLLSVPYALYAEKAGNGALPTATLNGTTLRYNGINSAWIIDTNLVNNGDKVRIGDKLNIKQNKLQSITNSPSDSAAIFGYHYSAGSNYSGIRGFAAGNSVSTGTTIGLGIFGGHFIGYNGSGTAIGAFGQATSAQSNAIGLLGIATSSGTALNNNYAIGLYASVDASTTATNKYAGVFNRGGVLISDSLILGPLTNPGNIGDVLTKTSPNGRASWVTPSAGGGPFTQSANYIHAANSYSNSRIVFGIPYPVGGFPYQSRVTIVNTSSNLNDTSLVVLQKNSNKPAIYANSNASGGSSAPAIFGEAIGNSPNSAGIYGMGGAFAVGVKGFANSFSGVWGESNGGPGVTGISTQSGQAGRFLLQSSISGFPAVYISTNSDPPGLTTETFGKGAAIRAINSSSITGSNFQSLLLDGGHIAASGSNINSTCSTTAVLTPSTVSISANKTATSNDVRGAVLVSMTPTATVNPGEFITINVPFDKSYSAGLPYVLIQPMDQSTASLSHYISGGSAASFTVKFFNGGTISVVISNLNFKYFVIE